MKGSGRCLVLRYYPRISPEGLTGAQLNTRDSFTFSLPLLVFPSSVYFYWHKMYCDVKRDVCGHSGENKR
jgi:hypothetical protein